MAGLTVIGGGRIGTAIVAGLIRSGWASADELAIVERDESARAALSVRFPGLAVTDAPVVSESVVVAVKPGDLEMACRSIRAREVKRVLSVAAGITTETLESWLEPGIAVVRAMPNTPALLGAGASAIASGSNASEEDLDWAESVLSAIGVVVRLPEHLLDAATGLSGSGPAYVFLVAEALIEAGVLVGLDRQSSQTLALQTIYGAAKMLVESGESPESLRASVTSPGGTTAEGLRLLESHAVRSALMEAVRAATSRSKELGRNR